jgi:hypothetical protein
MNTKPVYQIVSERFDRFTFAIWCGTGSFLSVLTWLWGTSSLATDVLKRASGFSASLILFLLVAPAPALAAFFLAKQRKFALGVLESVYRRALPMSFRTASFFLGVALIAGICWVVTGSANAGGSSLFSLLLSVELWWCWVGLVVIAEELTVRYGPRTVQ